MEEWRIIDVYPKYEVSSNGRVRNIKRKNILKQQVCPWGYKRVSLMGERRKHTTSVHRLVGGAFIPNPLNKPEINHIDGVKTNNNVNNLEWATGRENKIHAFATGLNDRKSYDSGRPKRKIMVEETGVTFNSIRECSEYLHCTHSAIVYCLRTEQKKCKGYHLIEL